MHQAVVQYAERAAEKLRGERQYCRQVTTFVRTSPFAVKEPCYSNAAVEKLPLPTQDSRDIIAAACRALNHVWREGYRYMKAGVMLADFTPSGIAQPGLFDEIQPRKNSEKLMKSKRLVRTVLIFTESSDQLSRATDRVPGLPASPGYVQ